MCFTIPVADFTWFYCSAAILTVTIFLFLWEVQGIETGSSWHLGGGEGRALVLEEGWPLAGLGSLVQFNTIPFSLQVSAVLQHPPPRGLPGWA